MSVRSENGHMKVVKAGRVINKVVVPELDSPDNNESQL